MADNEARVVLVRPGDYLMVGVVGHITDERARAANECLHALGLKRTVLFEADIELDKVPRAEGS